MRSHLLYALTIAIGLVTEVGRAALEKGDSVPNKCYTTVDSKRFCLEDAKDTIRVLIHNAGWCGPCNDEMEHLAPLVAANYAGMPVTFVSVSAYGWTSGSMPDQTFLKEWKDKHSIPFVVAGSPRDAGKAYFDPPLFIPNVVIIGKDGHVAYKAVAPQINELLQEVNSLLKLR